MSTLRIIPPSPDVIKSLYEQYLRDGQPIGISFKQYLHVIGFTNPAEDNHGMDDGVSFRGASGVGGPELISVPSQVVQGQLRVIALLVDFNDRQGSFPVSHYEDLLFSKNTHPTGSMRDYFDEVSLGKVDVVGEVHGWLRMPQNYSYYTNNQSGTGSYPRNAQGLAEHAVRVALENGVSFSQELDVLNQESVTAFFMIHAGVGAEEQFTEALRLNNIWSHKWGLPNPVKVAENLWVNRYLTVPNNARLGVCAHELGHLAFQWEDFYDPNYAEDGSAWDGSGDWDLMAGGSYNGNSRSPAHPVSLHKAQHNWIELEEVRSSKRLTIDPFTSESGKAYKLVSSKYLSKQYLILENRKRVGFDSQLPGEGLLVWRVDESKEMFRPEKPALQLVQADGRRELENVGDNNAGDSGDPFPGSTMRTSLFDTGSLSTSFPGGDDSGIALKNIVQDPATGKIILEAEFYGVPVDGHVVPPIVEPSETFLSQGESTPNMEIPDNNIEGIKDAIMLTANGAARGITVGVDISHTYIGDLTVALQAPNGKRAILHDKTGGSKDNLVKTYSMADAPALQELTDLPVRGEWKLLVTDNASRDTGTLNKWAIAVDSATEVPTLKKKSTPEIAIPDNDPSGVSDIIHVERSGLARSIIVAVNIVHPYIGDLRLELVGPTGERALLHNQAGGNTQNLDTSWKSTHIEALAKFIGKSIKGDWVLRVSDQAGNDLGTLVEWSLDIDLGSEAQTLEKSAEPNISIPDHDAAGASSFITVDQSGTVQTIKLQAQVTHSYVGDLRVELEAPSGKKVILRDKTGGNQKNLNLLMDSAQSPQLAKLIGQPLLGNWVLRVMDLEAEDVGTLDNWSLKVAYTD